MKKKVISIVAAAAAALLIASGVVYFGSGESAAKKIACPDAEATIQNSDKYLKDHNFDKEAFLSKWKSSSERITYRSINQNKIYFDYICHEKVVYDNPTILFIGSYGYDYQYLFPQADYFLDLGYNVILMDQRSHGNNDAESFTFGNEETDDIDAVLDYISRTIPMNTPPLAIYAQGTGALSACSYLSSKSNNFKFLILDDPELNGKQTAENMLKKEKSILPEKLLLKSGISSLESKYKIIFSKNDFTETSENTSTIFVPVLVLKHDNCEEYSSKSIDGFISNLTVSDSDKQAVAFENSEFMDIYFDEKQKFDECVSPFIWTNIQR